MQRLAALPGEGPEYEVPDDGVAPLGAWIASSLVRLADLQLAYVEAT